MKSHIVYFDDAAHVWGLLEEEDVPLPYHTVVLAFPYSTTDRHAATAFVDALNIRRAYPREWRYGEGLN